MPYVPKFKPDELKAIAQTMLKYPPDQVERDYRLGKISLNDKLFMLQKYGIAQREIAIIGTTAEKVAKNDAVTAAGGGATGELKYYAQNVIKEYKASWDAATGQDPSASKAIFHALVGSLNVLRAYDVPGDIAERWSLEMFPESPGFANAVNWAVWGYTNFVGISALLKPIFKGVQGGAKSAVAAGGVIADYSSFVKDPVEYAVKQARSLDAQMATKLATTKAGGEAAQGGVATAAIAAEKAGGKQAFTTAKPAERQALEGFIESKALTPQEMEAKTTAELIKYYEQRSREMIRSSTEPFKYEGVSHEATRAAASAKPISFDDILGRGPDAPISATELEAIGRVHKEVLDHFNAVVDEARKVIPDIQAGARPDLVSAYKAHLAAVEVTNPAFLSGRGQAGRGLEYLKTMPELIQNSLIFDTVNRGLSAEKYLNGTDDVIAYSIKKLGELTDKSRYSLLNEATKNPQATGTLRLFYKSLLFARPGIHLSNIVGNTGSIMLHGVNKTASAVVPWSDTSWREAMAYWSGMWDSRKTFMDLYAKAVERSSSNLTKAGIEGTATGYMVHHGPLFWLGAEDEMMEGVVRHGLAKSQVIKEGLSQWDELKRLADAGELPSQKKWLADFVDRSMADPKNYERLLDTVEKEADYIVFHSPLSHAGEAFAQGIRESKLDYIMPVVKFPIAGMKMARDWTPGLQMLSRDTMKALAEGGPAADALRSRIVLSWMISSQVYEAAKAGKITGGGPINPQANAVWRAAGNVPYAINGVPIKWAEPFGTWFGIIADAAQAANEMKVDDVSSLFSAAAMIGGRVITNNYWLRIMQGVTGAVAEAVNPTDINDLLGAAVKAVGQPVKTIIGGGTVGRTIAEAMNPEQADQRFYGEFEDLKNWFFAGTVWGKDSRPRIDNSGHVQITPPILGAEWVQKNLNIPEPWARGIMTAIMPPVREGLGNDEVAQFLDKHGLIVHNNFKYYGGSADIERELPLRGGHPRVSLNGDQAYNWEWLSKNEAQQYGTNRTWRKAIAALDADPNFLRKDRNQKQQEVNRLYASFRRTGLDMLRQRDPEVRAKELERDQLEAEQRNSPSMSIELAPSDEQQTEPSPIPQLVPTPEPAQSPPPAE